MKVKDIEEIKLLRGIDTLEFNCITCGKAVIIKKEKFMRSPKLMCRNCKTKATNFEKYGMERSPYAAQKAKETKLKKYGNENYNNRDQYKKTCIERYGKDSHLKNEEVQEKRKQTFLEKYGVEHNWSSKECREKAKQTCFEKYGDENYHNKEQVKKTMLEKYGAKTTMESSILRDKIKKTNFEKYGNEWQIASISTKEKIKKINIEKFGGETPFHSEEIQKKVQEYRKNTPGFYRNMAISTSKTRSKLKDVDNVFMDSSWEQSFIQSHPGCKRGPEINYEYNGKTHKWCIDFEWEEKFYEIKNSFYFNKNYPNWHPELTWAKWEKGVYLNQQGISIRWYLWPSMFKKDLNFNIIKIFENKNDYKKLNEYWNNFHSRFIVKEELSQLIGSNKIYLDQALNGNIQNLIISYFIDYFK